MLIPTGITRLDTEPNLQALPCFVLDLGRWLYIGYYEDGEGGKMIELNIWGLLHTQIDELRSINERIGAISG